MDHYHSPGAFAELLKVRCTAVYPIGDLDYKAAALAEPLTVAIDMIEAADIPLSGRVAVFGPGPIGLMICRLALLKGAARVYLTGKSHSRQRWHVAEQIGITQAIYVDQGDSVAQIRKLEPEGLDSVLVTSPPETISDAVDLCRFGGIIAYDGIKFGEAGNITLDGNKFHFNRLQLRGVHSVPNLGWYQALDLLRRKVIDPDLFISQTYPFDQVPDAVRFAAEKRDQVVKVMVSYESH
jgi:threonine dehydrogenase-like Zn-dependent dehydrogenase